MCYWALGRLGDSCSVLTSVSVYPVLSRCLCFMGYGSVLVYTCCVVRRARFASLSCNSSLLAPLLCAFSTSIMTFQMGVSILEVSGGLRLSLLASSVLFNTLNTLGSGCGAVALLVIGMRWLEQ